jgi:hypothetical protein
MTHSFPTGTFLSPPPIFRLGEFLRCPPSCTTLRVPWLCWVLPLPWSQLLYIFQKFSSVQVCWWHYLSSRTSKCFFLHFFYFRGRDELDPRSTWECLVSHLERHGKDGQMNEWMSKGYGVEPQGREEASVDTDLLPRQAIGRSPRWLTVDLMPYLVTGRSGKMGVSLVHIASEDELQSRLQGYPVFGLNLGGGS